MGSTSSHPPDRRVFVDVSGIDWDDDASIRRWAYQVWKHITDEWGNDMIEAPRTVLTDRYTAAVAYATDLHAAQSRKGNDIPYVAHLLGVSSLVLEAGGSEDRSALSGFTDRVWSRTEESGLPGSMKVFLSDGTLIEDSCWETHRLSPWRIVSETAVSWNEDGIDIDATIVSLTEAELVLRLRLADGAVEERYAAATVPYLCPDIPKG